ncbi:MAG: polyphosphate polymerase domain-containing protein [Bryobacterales bacterium]|nr:polyphosphate polymerase domain-containing protein [Bryobacterales bacterium]
MPLTEIRESRAFVQEMKFLIAPGCAAAIREWARAKMSPDPNAGGAAGDEYRVTSLYLETGDFAVYERRGSYGRSKYRVRRYGENDRIFLERKLKTNNRVGKMRSIVGLDEVALLDRESSPKRWAGRWFHERIEARELRPVCQISYSRMARLALSESGPIRLTVDQDLRALPVSGYRFGEAGAGAVLLPEQRILEIKYKLEIPGLFKELMQQFDLRPAASSKYRMAVEGLELKKEALCLRS